MQFAGKMFWVGVKISLKCHQIYKPSPPVAIFYFFLFIMWEKALFLPRPTPIPLF